MAKVGSLFVDLALESAQFIAGLKQANAATTQAANQISANMNLAKTAIKSFVGGFTGAFSIDLIQERIQEAFDYGDAIVDLSDRTGAATKTIQEFRYAAQLSGSSVESADAAVEKFAKNLGAAQNGNKAMIKTFADLGVTSTDSTVALRQTMDGISKLGTVTQRNQKTIEIFGKSAGDLTLLMSGGAKGFDALAEAARGYGLVLDDEVLRNGGKFNDQMDTMKMILNAQMAGMIIQNADAIMQLANSFVQAASAASQFFQQMDVNRLMSLRQNNPLQKDIPSMIAAYRSGKSQDQYSRDELMKTRAGRKALFDEQDRIRIAEVKAGRKGSNVYQAAQEGKRSIVEAEVAARRGMRIKPAPVVNSPDLPKPTGDKPKPSKSGSKPNLKSDAELEAQWEKAFLTSRSDLYRAQARLTTDPTERQDLEAKQLRNRLFSDDYDLKADTGTDQEVREGKKRYTEAQAKQLRQIQQEIFNAEYDATIQDREADISRDRLDLALNGLKIENDKLSEEMNLARSTKDRKVKALALLNNQFDQERLQLEQTIELAKLGKATKAEREAAEARLAALPALKALATEGVNRQNQSPLEAYLDQIPKTAGQINDQMEQIEVEGLNKLQDGIMGLIDGSKTFNEVWKDITQSILSGLIKIGLQQAIIKPLGNLLFGGGDGGGLGGLLGGLFKGAIKGARANGGMTGPGNYLVGERGPEVVKIGANANVVTNRELRNAANDNRGGVTVHFGNITSSNPAEVKRLATEAALQLGPVFQQQAVNATMTKLRRPGL